VISFLRNGIIISDTNGKLLEIKKKAQKIKIYKTLNEVKESKRRLRERSEENVKRIKEQIENGDMVFGTYLLKNITDEILEKLRMYDGDWLYTQKKTNLKFLNGAKHDAFRKIFLEINKPLTKSKLVKCTNSLQNLVEKID
jgi:hypothetical protein